MSDLNQTAQALAATGKAFAMAQANTLVARTALTTTLAARGILFPGSRIAHRIIRSGPPVKPSQKETLSPPVAADFNLLVTNLVNCITVETAKKTAYDAALKEDNAARAAAGL
jgi:hypothetical protein